MEPKNISENIPVIKEKEPYSSHEIISANDRIKNVDLKRVVSLLLFLVGYTSIGCLIFHFFENFIFDSDYATFKNWFPKYHKPIFALTFFFRIFLIISPILIPFFLKNHFLEIWRLIKNSISHFVYITRNFSLLENIKFRYLKAFLIFQFCLLLLCLIVWYSLDLKFSDLEFFEKQLHLSRLYILIALTFTAVYFIAFNFAAFSSKILTFLFSAASAYNLAIYRIAFFLTLIYTYSGLLHKSFTIIEHKDREALPFIGWLIEILPITQELYLIVTLTGIICCLFLVFGLFSRFFLFVNAVIVCYIIAVPNFYGKLWHSQFQIWVSWILLFAPVSDVYSLDKLFFKKKKQQSKSPNYNFPIKIIWLQFGIIYFWAGFYKLWDVGFEWALGETMINQVQLEWFEHFDNLPIFRIDYYPALLNIGGLICILFELSFGFFLFHPRLKYISIIGGILMHNVIGIFMYIAFLRLQVQYIVFLNFEKVLKWIKGKFSKFPYTDVIAINREDRVNKKMVYLSIMIISMNFIFGMFNISSFPFSTYPTYSEKVESSKEYFHYEILDDNKKNTNLWELGKRKNFRWENFTRLEYAIIKKYREQKVIDTPAIYNQWRWWSNHIDELKNIDSINVFIIKRHLNPDSIKIKSKQDFLLKIYPNGLEK